MGHIILVLQILVTEKECEKWEVNLNHYENWNWGHNSFSLAFDVCVCLHVFNTLSCSMCIYLCMCVGICIYTHIQK